VLLPLLAVAALVAALPSASRPAPVRAASVSPFLPRPPFGGPRQIVFYAHLKTAVRRGRAYELRVDPAWWLGGVTASRAAREDTGSGDVPNDYLIVEEGHRLLTYVVPPTARVTVITNERPAGIEATRIPVSELPRVARGLSPRGHRLFEPKAGFWIRAATDTVLAMDQQYQP
jgi:hypothetical protein